MLPYVAWEIYWGKFLSESGLHNANQLRSCILEHLYTYFKKYPLASIELRQLAEACRTNAQDLNWNMVYLERKGWISLDLSADCPPYIACTAGLTAEGIDLIEDTAAFASQFKKM